MKRDNKQTTKDKTQRSYSLLVGYLYMFHNAKIKDLKLGKSRLSKYKDKDTRDKEMNGDRTS